MPVIKKQATEKKSHPAALAAVSDRPFWPKYFGYAFASRQVRQYRINDPCTVRQAIEKNIDEYLYNDCEVPIYSRTVELVLVANAIAVAFGLASHWHPMKWPDSKPFIVLCVIVSGLLQLFAYYVANYVSGGGAFLEIDPNVGVGENVTRRGKPKPGPEKEPLPNFATYLNGQLVGKRIRMMTAMCGAPKPDGSRETTTTCICITAQIVEPAQSIWSMRPPKVLREVEHTYKYSRFFDRQGRIYPPNLTRVVDLLLSELTSKGSSS
jgi:hypothetical protein